MTKNKELLEEVHDLLLIMKKEIKDLKISMNRILEQQNSTKKNKG